MRPSLNIKTLFPIVFIVGLLLILFLATQSTPIESPENRFPLSANEVDVKYEEKIKELEQQIQDLTIKMDSLEQQMGELTVRINTIETKLNISKPSDTQEDTNTPPIPNDTTTNEQPFTVNKTITEKSGLTAEQLDKVLEYVLTVKYNKKDSKLLGQGQALYEMEQKYNVNALYALGVASFESGWGQEGVARQNNLFAFNGSNGYLTYSSVGESIDAFGEVTKNNYFDKSYDTLSKISKKYCPSNSDYWTTQVSWMVNFYTDIANEIL